MSLSFPPSPSVNQTYTVGTRTWTWTGVVWELTGATGLGAVGTEQILDAAVTSAKLSSNAVTTAKIADGAVTAVKLGPDAGGMPAGSIITFAGSSSPSGWLLCFGQAVSRTTYASLYSAIGTTYGVGDNSTTFNLPDLRGRVIAGLDNMGGSAASRLTNTTITGGAETLGNIGGAQTHLLTGAESGTSAHGHTGSTNTTGAHTHNVIGGGQNNINNGIRAPFDATLTTQNATTAAGDHSHTVTINNATAANASSAHNNVQPTIVMNYIIKV